MTGEQLLAALHRLTPEQRALRVFTLDHAGVVLEATPPKVVPAGKDALGEPYPPCIMVRVG